MRSVIIHIAADHHAPIWVQQLLWRLQNLVLWTQGAWCVLRCKHRLQWTMIPTSAGESFVVGLGVGLAICLLLVVTVVTLFLLFFLRCVLIGYKIYCMHSGSGNKLIPVRITLHIYTSALLVIAMTDLFDRILLRYIMDTFRPVSLTHSWCSVSVRQLTQLSTFLWLISLTQLQEVQK